MILVDAVLGVDFDGAFDVCLELGEAGVDAGQIHLNIEGGADFLLILLGRCYF